MSNTTTAVQRADERGSVKSLLAREDYGKRVSDLMGARAPQFVTSVIQISQTWNLKGCDPNTIIAAALTAASLDLPIHPTLGFAWIIPYKDKASFQIGYKGIVQLALRSGQYKRLSCTPIFEGEECNYDRVKGEAILTGQRKSDKATGYIAYLQLINGFERAEYWPKERVEKHAKRFSQAYKNNKADSPWFTDFDSMACKTVLKSLITHWGPMSVQMQTAAIRDNTVQAHVDSEPVPAEETETDPNKLVEFEGGAPADEKPPEATEGTTATQAPPKTPQQDLRTLLEGEGCTFDDFSKWAKGSGQAANADSWPDWDAVPSDLAKRLLRSPAGLVKGVKAKGA